MSSILSPSGDHPRARDRLSVRAAAGNPRIWAPRLLFSLAVVYAALGLAAGWWPLGR